MKTKKTILCVFIAVLFALAFAGCASSSAASGGESPYSVDLDTLRIYTIEADDVVGEPTDGTSRNVKPLTKAWDDVFMVFTDLPANITSYQRVTIRAKYYGVAADGVSVGEEIPQADENVIVTFVYDKNGDKRGPSMGPGPNTPIKEFNVGGFSGLISKDKGVRAKFSRAPDAILFQNNHTGVKFIEATEITFHNSVASAERTGSTAVAGTSTADTAAANTGGTANAAVAAIPDDGRPKVAVYVTSGADRGAEARALSGLGAFNTVGNGLAKAISDTEKGHGVNLTDEITKTHGANVSISQANAVGQQYGVQYLCIVTISNVNILGRSFRLGIDLVDVSKSQRTAFANGGIELSNPAGMLVNLGRMALDLSAGLVINAVLN